ncbi:MAG: hypothetical protein MAG453_01592 [Calditrichaeota bacterium]|nr:hypothetical protein [Calditrichota bacterium]
MKRPYLPFFLVLLLLLAAAVWWALAVVLNEWIGVPGRIAAEAIALFVVLVLLVEILLRAIDLRRRAVNDERQLQALLGLYTALKPRAPLPMLRTAALSPDTALEYIRLIRQLRPETVLELGSGVSTVLAALQVRENGYGRVVAVEDDADWAKKTADDLAEHGVREWAEIRHAALAPAQVDGDTVDWYDPETLADIERIDMLLVDGPRDLEDRGNRRPGLTHLHERFSRDVVIVVDDGIRARWNNWVHAWAREHGFIVREPFLNEKRSMFLFRSSPHPTRRPADTTSRGG